MLNGLCLIIVSFHVNQCGMLSKLIILLFGLGCYGREDQNPRCSIICWLVCKNKLRTKDRPYIWTVVAAYSIWHFVVGMMRINITAFSIAASQGRCGTLLCIDATSSKDAIVSTIGRLVFAVTLYCIWRERNQRILRSCAREYHMWLKKLLGSFELKFRKLVDIC